MKKLFVVMVGLPARGKSTMARRIYQGLLAEGIKAKIFNNGDIRRSLIGAKSTNADFYNPSNKETREIREQICLKNLECACTWINKEGDVAILDATNASLSRRLMIIDKLKEYPVLFVECVNEDPLLLSASIKAKTKLPEYKSFSEDQAMESFMKRIEYYEEIYDPLGKEPYWICVDSMANRILDESPIESHPCYPAIREILVNFWIENLYLARHGQTEFNIQGRIGGDPPLTIKGQNQAKALANTMKNKELSWIFTSTRLRSHETAAPILKDKPDAHVMALNEFDEIWAGDCEGMLYSEIREKMPEVSAGRNSDKYRYAYPNGESYAILQERVRRGLRRALFLAENSPLLIIGHQAINRVLLSLLLRQRTEDVPYIHIPQNQYYHISLTPHKKVFERINYSYDS